jgi:hypothetical protein
VRRFVLSVVALAIAAPAAAQPAKPAPPPTSAEIAAAKAHADRIIAAAEAGDLFVNVTTGGVAEVRHVKSGLECGFDPEDSKGGVTIFKNAQVPRGDDVGCDSHLQGILVSTFVTRYPTPVTARQVVEQSEGAIRTQFTDIKDWSGPAASLKEDTPPGQLPRAPSIVLRLAANFQGQPKFTRSAAATCGPWTIAQRVTGSADRALEADLAAELELHKAVEKVCASAAKAPAP